MFTEVIYRFLRGRMRAPEPAIPQGRIDFFLAKFGVDLPAKIPLILLGSNPGNIGHQWVKNSFIDGAEPFEVRRMSKAEGGMLRQYIPAKLEDNPHVDADDYEGKLQGLGSKELVKRHAARRLEHRRRGVLRHPQRGAPQAARFTPPAHWTRFRSLDWGSAKPFSVGWWVVAEAEWVKFATARSACCRRRAGALPRVVRRQEGRDGRSSPTSACA
jgi:hypothetical protein